MSREDVALTIAVANFVLTWGVALYMYLANKNKVTNERIQKLEEATNGRIEKLEDDIDDKLTGHIKAEEQKFTEIATGMSSSAGRLRAVEVAIEAAPTHDDLGHIHEKINRTLEAVGTLTGELKALVSNVHLIHEHLLKGGK